MANTPINRNRVVQIINDGLLRAQFSFQITPITIADISIGSGYFSIITDNNQTRLSPCYDLVNSTIELQKQAEEIALPLKGMKKRLTRNLLVDYFGIERCELTFKSIDKVLGTIESAIPKWKTLIDISFLSEEMKEKYHDLLNNRLNIMKLQ